MRNVLRHNVLTALLMAAAALLGTPLQASAWTNGPIWDAKVVWGDSPGIGCGQGFVRVDTDLNEGAGGQYVYLCVSYDKAEHAEPIAGMMVCNMACPPGYTIVRAEPFHLPGYLNAGVSGGHLLIFGYYRGMTSPLREVAFAATDSSDSMEQCRLLAPDAHFNYWYPMPGIQDLNRGGGGKYIAPCVRYMPGGTRNAAGLVWDMAVDSGQQHLTDTACPGGYSNTGMNLTGNEWTTLVCVTESTDSPFYADFTGAVARLGTVARNVGSGVALDEPCAEIGGTTIELFSNHFGYNAQREIRFCLSRAHTPQDPDRVIDSVGFVELDHQPEHPEAACAQHLGDGWEAVRAINEPGVNDLRHGLGGAFLYACVHKSPQYVEHAFDGPVITPGDKTVFTVAATERTPEGLIGARLDYVATAADAIDGYLAISCDPPPGTLFTRRVFVGVVMPGLIQCEATDLHGNLTTALYLVNVVDTPPTLTFPLDITFTSNDPVARIVTYAVSATDLLDGVLTVTCTHPSGTLFPAGVTEVSCVATDSAGQQAEGRFFVSILGTPPPALPGESTPPPAETPTNPPGVDNGPMPQEPPAPPAPDPATPPVSPSEPATTQPEAPSTPPVEPPPPVEPAPSAEPPVPVSPAPPDVKTPEQLFDALDAAISLRRLDDDVRRIHRSIERSRIRRACKQLLQLEQAITKHRKIVAADKTVLLDHVRALASAIGCAP